MSDEEYTYENTLSTGLIKLSELVDSEHVRGCMTVVMTPEGASTWTTTTEEFDTASSYQELHKRLVQECLPRLDQFMKVIREVRSE